MVLDRFSHSSPEPPGSQKFFRAINIRVMTVYCFAKYAQLFAPLDHSPVQLS